MALLLIFVKVNAQVVAFDRILSQPVYINDPGPSGISQLATTLQNNGINVFTLQSSSGYNTLATCGDNLSHYVFVFTPTIHRAYPNYILQDITYLIKNGAHIIVVAEHENYYYNADNLNKICEPYGIHINNNAIKKCDAPDFECAWPVGKSEKYGLNNIRFYLPASLQCANGVEKIASIDTAVICASVKVGNGRVTVLGDYEMLWNMTPTHGINYGDNKAFMSKLFYVAPDTSAAFGTLPWRMQNLKKDTDSGGPGRFLIAEDIANPAEITKSDVVFFIKPTTYLTWPDSAFKKIGKAVIVGGEYSNYFTLLEKEGGINILSTLGYTHQDLPINKIAAHFGLEFSESVINAGGINNISDSINPICCTHPIGEDSNNFFEAGSFITKTTPDDNSFTTVFKTVGSYKELYYYGPLGFDLALGPDSIITMPNGATLTNAPLCLYNKRVFAVSYNYLWDQLLSPTSNDMPMQKAFVKWLGLR